MKVTAQQVLARLEAMGSAKNRDGMARYAIVAPKVFGVSVADLRKMGKEIGRNHKLAADLWKTEWYEARMLASFVDDPASVSPSQMDRWARDFDNWAICDTVCFHLFDKTAHAYDKVTQWAASDREFVKRAAFALAASLALHDRKAPDEKFAPFLPLMESAATDDRNFVKKGVSWALRSIALRRASLRAPALALAKKLAESESPAARWIGRDAVRDITKNAKR